MLALAGSLASDRSSSSVRVLSMALALGSSISHVRVVSLWLGDCFDGLDVSVSIAWFSFSESVSIGR